MSSKRSATTGAQRSADRPGRGRTMPVIGILGGIAAGKSLAADALAAEGAVVINVDAIGHRLLGEPEVAGALEGRFGARILGADGHVSRPALAEIVFADAEALDFLNGLTHPRMREEIERRITEAEQAGAPAVVIDAALLLEHDLGARWCSHLIYVDAPRQARLERAAARGWSADHVALREQAQMPLEQKKGSAEVIFSNDADPAALADSVVSWFHSLRRARPRRRPGAECERP
jgi:dephospho-CoA kinase